MKAKPGEVRFAWNTRENDVGFAWGGAGANKADANLICSHLIHTKTVHGTTLLDELKARGYDLSTFRLSIERTR